MQRITTYLEEVAHTVKHLPPEEIQELLTRLLEAYHRRATIFTLGNGGSASTASHFACDLSKGTLAPGTDQRFRVVALTDNLALLTAWSNDSAYEFVFQEQLRNLGRPGDVVLAISGSGNSPNVLRAVEEADRRGMVTLGLVGFDGGKLLGLVDHAVHVKLQNMMQVEDAHMVVCHLMTCWLRDELAVQQTSETAASA